MQSIQTGSIKLAGQITVTNGSAAIAGIGTAFTGIAAQHLSYSSGIVVVDSAGDAYYISGLTVIDDTNATITAVTLDAFNGPVPAATFPGVTGTYDFYLLFSNAVGDGSIAIGSNAAATGLYSMALGSLATALAAIANNGETTAVGDTSLANGDYASAWASNAIATGDGAQALGAFTVATGAGAVTVGYDFTNATPNSVGLGSSALFALATADRFEVKNPGGGASDVVICSPDGTRWKVVVSNLGAVTAAAA